MVFTSNYHILTSKSIRFVLETNTFYTSVLG